MLRQAKPRRPGSAHPSQLGHLCPGSLASACLHAPAPSSAGSLRADPALPMQSIQDGARPPVLGRIITGK